MTWHLPRIGNEAFEVSRFLGSPMLHLSREERDESYPATRRENKQPRIFRFAQDDIRIETVLIDEINFGRDGDNSPLVTHVE